MCSDDWREVFQGHGYVKDQKLSFKILRVIL